ncbi:isochorismatase family protein [Amycolatopsis rubida]|uniref:Nicotinamidase-related amidase n=1 Tax=Amycolatopsis rubida TaxID=112413 RepID=A0A1I5V5S4_9PSEU|nr:isochorismatase family protein [Amycolatopsis rubida]SFQ02791.1 Nicotinamidase-related amidase [Amycolatopsis rubida]
MTAPQPWDRYLTARDHRVRELAGLGRRQGLGRRPALLVIDVTTNFCGEKREPLLDSIRRWRNSCGEAAWDAVDRIAGLLALARTLEVPVLYSAGLDTGGNPVLSGRWRDKNSRRDEDSDPGRAGGHDIVAPIAPRPGEIVVRKTKPSVFHGTPLASFLVDLGVDSLVVCGGSTSGCVRATVVDAFSANYRVTVAGDACFDRFDASHAMTLFDLDQKYADVTTAARAGEALQSVHGGAPADD